MEFYRKGTNEQELLRSVNRLVEQGMRYENVDVKSSSAASGETTFSYSSG